MIIKSNWHSIPDKEINKPQHVTENGRKFLETISPWDFPKQFRILLSISETSSISIEMKYLSESESTVEKIKDHGVIFTEGKNSGRVYKILMPISLLKNHVSKVPGIPPKELEKPLDELINQINDLNDEITNRNNADAVSKTANWLFSHPHKLKLMPALT